MLVQDSKSPGALAWHHVETQDFPLSVVLQ